MIPLIQILEDLTYGELAHTSLSGKLNQPKGINPSDYPIIIRHINSALADIYTRFSLKENEVILQQFDSITEYTLSSRYAVSTDDPNEPFKWILDSVETPFLDDISQVIAVYDGAGLPVPLNDVAQPNSVLMVNYNLMQIPYPVEGNVLALMYRAMHPRIDPTSDVSAVYVEIPLPLREPLMWYVASRVYGSKLGEDDRALSAEFLRRYNGRMDELQREGIYAFNDEQTDYKFTLGGWK